MVKKAQSITEYAILIGVVLSAFLGIQLYLKRCYQAHLKGASDMATSLIGVRQYEPYYLYENRKTTVTQNTEEKYQKGDIEYNFYSFSTSSEEKVTGIDTQYDDDWFNN